MTCLQCNKPTNNPKFCSQSCSATYNNSRRSSRLSKICKHLECNNKIPSNRTYCDTHKKYKQAPILEDLTLEDAVYLSLPRASTFSKIRARARIVCKNRPQQCVKCGYNKHVEVCHITPIASFSKEALVSEINSEDNLVLLCPNCHWELDNGFIEPSELYLLPAL